MKLIVDFPPGQFGELMRRKAEEIAKAAALGARQAAPAIRQELRAVIGGAGFGSKWQQTLRVNVYPQQPQQRSSDVALFVYHKIPYSRVFAEGATIHGSPYLWVPLPTAPLRVGGRRVTAGNFRQLVGAPLISIPGSHRPLLGAVIRTNAPLRKGRFTATQFRTGRRAQVRGAFAKRQGSFATQLVPLFVGVPNVTLRKRFDLDPALRRGADELANAIRRNLGKL